MSEMKWPKNKKYSPNIRAILRSYDKTLKDKCEDVVSHPSIVSKKDIS